MQRHNTFNTQRLGLPESVLVLLTRCPCEADQKMKEYDDVSLAELNGLLKS